MQEIIRYIIQFLCYGNESAVQKVNYVEQLDPSTSYPVTIVGNGLKRSIHYPDYTEPKVERLVNGHYVIYTDLVYNTFFFISRAEEVINTQRDAYGRFLARYSRYSNNDWQIPLVDEYSRLILKLTDSPLPEPDFSAVHLTHDIDILTYYRHWRGAFGGIYRGHAHSVLAAWQDIHKDPAYTFPWLVEQDAHVKQAQVIYFVKHTSGKGIDYPQYNLNSKDYIATKQMLQNSGAQTGIHSSAYADYPLPQGKVHRSHYLSCSIDRMRQIADAGYTDDYSMGFADYAGFRLRTTRAVRWINPKTRQLTQLVLHPLTIMDCTLSNANYMNLSNDEAYFYASELIDKVRQHHGELNLLWHNTAIADDNYHKSLYSKLLQLI